MNGAAVPRCGGCWRVSSASIKPTVVYDQSNIPIDSYIYLATFIDLVLLEQSEGLVSKFLHQVGD